MADVSINDFLPQVLAFAPQVPRPIAAEQVRQAAIVFCERTRCWRDTQTFAVTVNPTTIPTPANGIVFEIESVEFEGVALEEAFWRDFDLADVTAVADLAPPEYFTQQKPGEIYLIPLKAGDVTVRSFLKPEDGVVFGGASTRNTVPDFLLSHHGMYVAYGALASLLLIPDKDWTDATRALHFKSLFEARMDAVAHDFRRGQQRKARRTRRSIWM